MEVSAVVFVLAVATSDFCGATLRAHTAERSAVAIRTCDARMVSSEKEKDGNLDVWAANHH